jgi:Ca2+-binding EF-hand superfamily protein
MKQFALLCAVVVVLAAAMGCAAKGRHHDTALPEPKQFNAHFGDMDTQKDGRVTWEEFKAYFPQAEPKVFAAIDLNKDGAIDHDEWHTFKAAHGLKHG